MFKDKLPKIGGLFESKAKRQAREERERQEREALIAQQEAEERARQEELDRKDPHRLGDLAFTMVTGYYDAKKREDVTKKVVLVNPQDCKKVKAMVLVSLWRGSGHMEWEAYWATAFLLLCDQAIKSGEAEADISMIFQQDYYAGPDRRFSAEQTYEHILTTEKCLDIISDTDEEIKIRLRVAKEDAA